jgi:hypothetical protein
MTMIRERGVKVGLVIALLVVAVFGSLVLRQRGNYHQWPWRSLPDRLDHCDRSYAPGDWVSVNDAPRLELDFRFAPALAPHHDVYVEPRKSSTNGQGNPCPMGSFMKDGAGYQVYGLLGGP